MKTIGNNKHIIKIICLMIITMTISVSYIITEIKNVRYIENLSMSNNTDNVYINNSILLSKYEYDILNSLVEKYKIQFYIDSIPEEFNKAFLHNTENDIEHRMDFYSLMTVESVNFKYYVSKINSNGSKDYGPSQLNSDNIKNPEFMRLYGVTDWTYIDTKYTEYMIISYNYYKDLLEKYGKEYVFYTYNGGPKAKRYIENNLDPESTFVRNITTYNNNIRNAIKANTEDYNFYISYNVCDDYIRNHNGTFHELHVFDYKSDDIHISKSVITGIVFHNEELLRSYTLEDYFHIEHEDKNLISIKNILKTFNKILLKNDDDIIITLDDREIFKTVHIFVRNGFDIYFGTHYLYEFC